MSLFLGMAIYIVIWWLCFMAVLPYGAESLAERGEAAEPGIERAAPKHHRLGLKVVLASAIAAILWLGVAWAVSVDLIGMRAG
jgi:predicted secreted protein